MAHARAKMCMVGKWRTLRVFIRLVHILVRDQGILSSGNSPTNLASIGATEGATRQSLFGTTGDFNAFAICFSHTVELAPAEMIRHLAAE